MAPTNDALRSRFKKYARPAWSPETEPAGASDPRSRYSGFPLLKTGERWPVCGECGRELQLYLQLELADIPAAAQAQLGLNSGTLQFFYCTANDTHDGSQPFSKSHMLRILPPGENTGMATAVPGAIARYFPTKVITGWTAFEDFPSPEEPDALPGMNDDEYDAYYVSEPYLNAEGDKLLGWPNWVQDEEYPDCPECGRRMNLVYQLDSFREAGWLWGDAGIGHITQCPTHRNVLAFGWASA